MDNQKQWVFDFVVSSDEPITPDACQELMDVIKKWISDKGCHVAGGFYQEEDYAEDYSENEPESYDEENHGG